MLNHLHDLRFPCARHFPPMSLFPLWTMILLYVMNPLLLVIRIIEKLTLLSTKLIFVIFFHALFSLFFLKSSNKVLFIYFQLRLFQIFSTKTLLDIFNQDFSRYLQPRLFQTYLTQVMILLIVHVKASYKHINRKTQK